MIHVDVPQKLSSNGGSSPTEFAKRVKNLFTSSSPLNKKRSASLDALDSKPGEISHGYIHSLST